MSTKSFNLAHLDSAVHAIAQQDDYARALHLQREVFIYHRTAQRTQQWLNHFLRTPPRYRPPGLYLCGGSGTGKTSHLRTFERNHPPFNSPEGGRRVPVVYVLMNEQPRIEDMYQALLDAAGVNRNTFPSKMGLPTQVERAFKMLGVRVVLIDEVHNICDKNGEREELMRTWIRMLGNRLRIPIVVAGTAKFKSALEVDVELALRFPFMIEAPLWTDTTEFEAFLGAWQRLLPLRGPSNLVAPSMRKAILLESFGVTDLIAKCLTGAALTAIRLQRECITEDLLCWWRDPPILGEDTDDHEAIAKAWLEDRRTAPDPIPLSHAGVLGVLAKEFAKLRVG